MATTKFAAPYVVASQNQKHVTVNEQADIWDLFLDATLESISVTTQPASPTLGQAWYVPVGASGAGWSINTDKIARYDNGWKYYSIPDYFTFYVKDEGARKTYIDGVWYWEDAHISGASSGNQVKEISSSPSGALVTLTAAIPANSVVSAVMCHVTTAITGPTSFRVGVTGEDNKFGSLIPITLNTRNYGLIAPTAYYTDTNIILTPAGGNFSTGVLKLYLHMKRFTLPDV